MNKFIAICLAATGLAGLPLASATAHEAPACVVAPVAGTVAALPATARINVTVVVGVHRHHYRRVRRVYYRHGHRVVVYRRVYY